MPRQHGRAESTSPERGQAGLVTGAAGCAPDTAAALHREKEEFENAMESQPVIDMARGVLMATFTCSPEDAWEILMTVSQHANVKLREVAQAITAAAAGEPMPAVLQEQLASAVQTRRTRPDGIDTGASA